MILIDIGIHEIIETKLEKSAIVIAFPEKKYNKFICFERFYSFNK